MNATIHKNIFYFPSLYIRQQNISKYLSSLEETQWYQKSELENIECDKLLKLLTHAKINIPFYNKLFRHVNVESIRSVSDIQKIPFLNKEELKKQRGSLLFGKGKCVFKKTTGGSTGNPVTVFQSPEAIAAADAAYWRGFGWAGVDICDRQGRFLGYARQSQRHYDNQSQGFHPKQDSFFCIFVYRR